MGDRTNRVGQQVGDYRLLRWLGGGGFGDVYLGEHIYKQTQAAVKILQVRLTRREELREFVNEARIIRLQHPHIVTLLDFGIGNDDVPFLVMAYAPNGTLRDRHPKGSRLPLSTIVSYVRPMASALHYAHTLRLIHRDVKPENMLVGPQQEVLLSDFGIATVAQSTRSLSTEQGIGGTVPYMAPEQIQGKPRTASDQYALGIVVYEWITGRWPFKGTPVEIAMQHSMTPPPALREQLPALPMAVEEVVLTALAKDPKQRFADIEEFAEAFKEASEQGDIPRKAPEHSVSNGLTLPHDPILARHPIDKVDIVGVEATKSVNEPVFPATPSEVEEPPPIMQPVDGLLPLPIATTPAFTLSKLEQPSPYPPHTWTFQSPRRKRLSRRTAVLLLILALLTLGVGGGLYMSMSFFTAQMRARAGQSTSKPPVPTKTMTTTPLPGGIVLAKDTFQRADQTWWGTASDGRLWGGDANSIEVYSIVNDAGQVDHAQGNFNAVLGALNTNAEVLISVSVNQFVAGVPGGKVNVGAVLRWTDANNWYKALIDGTNLQILSRINGVTNLLASVPFQARGGVTYNLRFRVVGSNLFARAWPANQPEPAAWMVTVTDSGLAQGMGGIRVLLLNSTVIRVTSFLETTT